MRMRITERNMTIFKINKHRMPIYPYKDELQVS